MKTSLSQSSMDKIIQGIIKKNIFGAVFYISSIDDRIDLISASGNITPEDSYYIASINKLFLSSVVLRLYARDRINLDNKISDYISEELMTGLHIYNGQEYSSELTISHLLSHTSGLPCYLTDKQIDGKKVMTKLEAGIDQPWPVEKVIQSVKDMKTHFPPGQPGKPIYSDTNYQLLNLIIESVTGNPVKSVLNDLFKELNLDNTNVFEN
jgi:CubicO group peptidase (beta-lactamase class C family)